jgi:SecD/SecF fusion protein
VSSRRAQLSLLALIIAALVGVAAIALPQSPFYDKPVLGLDLQGGLELTLEAVPPVGRELTEEDLDRSEEKIRQRIDELGVSEPEVRQQGDNQITIGLAGVFDRERARRIIGRTGQLELWKLQENLVGPSVDANGDPVASTSLFQLLTDARPLAEEGTPSGYYLFNGQRKLVAGPFPTEKALRATTAYKNAAKNGELPKNFRVLGLPEETVIVTCDEDARLCPNGLQGIFPPTQKYFYLFRFTGPDGDPPIPEMTGRDIDTEGVRQDFDPRTSEPIVLMAFTDAGADKFHDITRALADNGKTKANLQNLSDEEAFQNFAIVLDREIQSFPQIDYNENPDGIPGNNGAQITGLEGIDEAKDLALVLKEALPIKFNTVDETDVSATLGKESLQQASKAIIAGLIIVALFLLVFYRFLGVVAVIGLGIYAAFLYAAILLFDVTLTLPGFAGMVLTLGVAADANIVIFERIKEEFRAGKSVRAAISTGYQKGFATIVDANVVTVISAVIIFLVATAGVRGFALMLLIGTGLSLITAVFATRAILGLLARFRWFDNPAFMGASSEQIPSWQKIDIVGRRRIWFAISGTLIALSILSIAVKGLNLGIDFKGGSAVDFSTPQPTALETVRSEMEQIGRGDDVLQGRGERSSGDRYREFQIKTESLDRAEQQQLSSTLRRDLNAQIEEFRNVSESFSSQIVRGAIYAIVLSFVLIAIYITIRFEWRFSLPILRTLLNDVLITVGIYSLSAREFNASTVAALLTILGYSIYDTIIIFDRVRENIPLMRRASFAAIANQSLWETVRRSLATTIITLLPVATLFFFGGETLKDFAFAILVGIGISAFSTIFIATPFLAVLKEREPQWRERKDSLDRSKVGAPPVEPVTVAQAEAEMEPEPAVEPEEPEEVTAVPAASGDGRAAQAKRERRRQRRKTRPHGRAR